MKTKQFSILILLALLAACSGGGTPVEPSVPPVSPTPAELHAIVNDLINQVDGHPRADPAWEPAFVDMSIFLGGEVRAKEASTARLKLEGNLIRVAPNTIFTLNQPDEQTLQLDLQEGQIWLNVEGLAPGEKFEVETPGASASVRGTRFSVRVNKKQTTFVSVVGGTVSVDGLSTSVDVTTGMQTTVPVGGDPTTPVPMSTEEQLSWGMAQGPNLDTVLPVSVHSLCQMDLPGTLSGYPMLNTQTGQLWFKIYPPPPAPDKHIPPEAKAFTVSTCAPVAPPPFVSKDTSYYAFNATGDKVAYIDYEKASQVCSSKVDGAEKTCFPFDGAGTKSYPSNVHWSPDSQWLLYDTHYYDLGLGSINKARPDGSETTYIAALETGYNSRGTWSPDGTQVAYAQVASAPDMKEAYKQPANLWVAGADGSNPQMIFEGILASGFPLAWSPDGKWIAVETASEDLWLVSPDGKEKQLLVGAAENIGISHVMWSPTATGWPLFYHLSKENDVRELHYVAALGESPQMLLNDIFWGPYWSSDASLLFVGQRAILDKEKQLYVSTFYVVQSYPSLIP